VDGPKLLSVVGARPNFVKMAPIISELERRVAPGSHVLVHTGQHYDRLLSEVFLEELGLRAPDHLLEVGSGTHAEQTARVMERLEPVLMDERPDLMIVAGDVNSTLAAALVAAKLHVPIAHVESGLRSFDRSMPEEINRIVTDQLSDLLFVHCADAVENLRREGIPDSRIHFVGNTMIDSLVAVEDRFRSLRVAESLGLPVGGYLLVTLHRPALVDGPLLEVVLSRLAEIGRELPVVLPTHPRTARALERLDPDAAAEITLTEPLSYLNFLSLQVDAAAVLTDSGGVQEESTYLGVPCFTLRSTTERPVTIVSGTNSLLGLDPDRILEIPGQIARNGHVQPSQPALWDGRAAGRLVEVLLSAALPLPVPG
jgi:UDP-N-acetylglucosamine 2-epimerase (non-hydrolysing)